MGKKPGDCSKLQRHQYFPPETYMAIIQAAAKGVHGPKNKDGLPLLAVVVLDPFNGACMQGALELQKQSKNPQGSQGGRIDVRAICCPNDETEESRLVGELEELVGAAWYNNHLIVEGHKLRSSAKSSVDIDMVKTAPVFDIACLDATGHLTVPERVLQPFLTEESIRVQVEAFLARFAADYKKADSPVFNIAKPQASAI
jgi:hypothetical protein